VYIKLDNGREVSIKGHVQLVISVPRKGMRRGTHSCYEVEYEKFDVYLPKTPQSVKVVLREEKNALSKGRKLLLILIERDNNAKF
jgi:hypothetical protein